MKIRNSASFVPAAHFEVGILVVLVVFRFQLKRIEGNPMAVSNLVEAARVGARVSLADNGARAKSGEWVDLCRSIFYRV